MMGRWHSILPGAQHCDVCVLVSQQPALVAGPGWLGLQVGVGLSTHVWMMCAQLVSRPHAEPMQQALDRCASDTSTGENGGVGQARVTLWTRSATRPASREVCSVCCRGGLAVGSVPEPVGARLAACNQQKGVNYSYMGGTGIVRHAGGHKSCSPRHGHLPAAILSRGGQTAPRCRQS